MPAFPFWIPILIWNIYKNTINLWLIQWPFAINKVSSKFEYNLSGCFHYVWKHDFEPYDQNNKSIWNDGNSCEFGIIAHFKFVIGFRQNSLTRKVYFMNLINERLSNFKRKYHRRFKNVSDYKVRVCCLNSETILQSIKFQSNELIH